MDKDPRETTNALLTTIFWLGVIVALTALPQLLPLALVLLFWRWIQVIITAIVYGGAAVVLGLQKIYQLLHTPINLKFWK